MSPGAFGHLAEVVQRLSLATSSQQVLKTLARASRELVGCDGVTVALRDGAMSWYLAEDTLRPLFAPGRFPIETCLSGQCILSGQQLSLPDVFDDPRVPAALYAETFVKSAGLVPIRSREPIGALAFYWAAQHVMSPEEFEVAQALADCASVALDSLARSATLERTLLEQAEGLSLLEQRNQELSLFSGAVAHDFRGPLTVLRAAASTLLDDDVAADERLECVRDVERVGALLKAQLNGLASLSRISGSHLRVEPIDVTALVQQHVDFLASTRGGAAVRFDVESGMTATTDGALLHVVVQNLLENAVKYSAKVPQPEVHVRHAAKAEGPWFEVEDNGVGFDARALRFKPFERFHGDAFEGTGLGLSLVHRAVQRLGGALVVESSPGAGTRVRFSVGPG